MFCKNNINFTTYHQPAAAAINR